MGGRLWDNRKVTNYTRRRPPSRRLEILQPMATAHKSVLYGMLAAFAAALGVFAALQLSGARTESSLQSGTQLPQPRALAPFRMIDHNGQPFTQQQLAGQWTLLFPGFTYCPDVCPTTLSLLKQLKAGFGAGEAFRVVFLSVDPQRDTPERLKAYVGHFDPAFVGVTAPEPQLGEVARGFGLAYAKVPGTTPDSYQMDHSAALVLLNPQGQIVAYFTPPFDAVKLGADLRQIMRAGS